MAPKIRKDLDIPEVVQRSAQATLKNALNSLERGWLANADYLTGDSFSIADFAAYVEIGQLQPEFTNVFDLTGFPRVCQWLNRMQQIDGHDDVHVVLTELGDISQDPPSMERIKNANKSALGALKRRLNG